MRPFDVQVMGAVVLHQGSIAEMKTGEGKTLVATMPVYLNALAGQGVHLVTVNDYLASRDAAWMGPVYEFLGLTVAALSEQHGSRPSDGRPTPADITYGTNTEFGFDYLRDNMVLRTEQQVQRGHFYCIVDEVDSILVDEARTPLIISGPGERAAKTYYDFARIARRLKPGEGEDGRLRGRREEAHRGHHRGGLARVEQELGIDNIYEDLSGQLVNHLMQALRAAVAIQARCRLSGAGRRGQDHRRVHRPHPRRAGGTPRGCTRPSRPKRASRSRKRTRRSPPSPCRTTSACTRRSRA